MNSPTPSTFSCCKIRFKTQVSSCFPSEAMLWIEEVEMVESVDEFKSARSIQGYCLLNPCNVVAQWSHHSLVQ